MGKRERRLAEDRALRDTARQLFRKELDHVREEVTPTSLGERFGDHVGERIDKASNNAFAYLEKIGGKLFMAAGVAAAGVGIWFARKPIVAQFASLFSNDEGELADEEQEDGLNDEDLSDG